MPRFELHVHTSECDIAAHTGAAELVRIYHAAGYDGMVITDHYFWQFFDWFSQELKGADHRTAMARRLKGYYAARNEGEKLGMTILPGAELRFNKSPYGINDFLILGCDEEFFLTAPRLHELTSLEALNALLPPEACVVLAHPFREGMTVMNPAPLFGVETYNAKNTPFQNRLAEQFAAEWGKAVTSGSDCHAADQAAGGGIETPRQIRTPKDLSAVLRAGDYTIYRGSEPR